MTKTRTKLHIHILPLLLCMVLLAAAVPVTVSAYDGSTTVYITKTGEKYHSGGCRHLRKSKYAISLRDAIDSGYEPCAVCSPPRSYSQTTGTGRSSSSSYGSGSSSGTSSSYGSSYAGSTRSYNASDIVENVFNYEVNTKKGSLNVRNNPDTDSDIVGTLSKGGILYGSYAKKKDGKAEWIYGWGYDAVSGRTISGWVSAAYLKKQ